MRGVTERLIRLLDAAERIQRLAERPSLRRLFHLISTSSSPGRRKLSPGAITALRGAAHDVAHAVRSLEDARAVSR